MSKLKVDIKKCARCGQDHPGLEFDTLTRPMDVELGEFSISYQWWATCPVNWQPIMMNVELTKP